MRKLLICLALLMAANVHAGKSSLKEQHKAMDMTCADCHQTKMPKVMPDQDTCISCHGPLEELKEAANQPQNEYYMDRNPHKSFHYNYGVDCMGCHSEHKESRLYCNNCHEFEMMMPEQK